MSRKDTGSREKRSIRPFASSDDPTADILNLLRKLPRSVQWQIIGFLHLAESFETVEAHLDVTPAGEPKLSIGISRPTH